MKRIGLILIPAMLLAIALGIWQFRSKQTDLIEFEIDDLATTELFGPKLELADLYSPPIVSKETTFVTDPINADGFVDYYAALNRRFSDGVTVQTNAAVLFFKAGVGLSGMEPSRRQRYARLLEINSTESTEPEFQNLDNSDDEETKRLIEVVTSTPWSADQFPRLHDWLKLNQAPLELIIEGTRRPHCYFPLLPSDDEGSSLIHIPLEFHQATRSVARCLVARSLLRIGEGRIAEAEKDLLACHRLGRMVGESPFLIGGLVGHSIESMALRGDTTLLHQDRLNAADALAFQHELRQLPPFAAMIDKLAFAERLSLLDSVMNKERGVDFKLPISSALLSEEAKTEIRAKLLTMRNESLRRCNERTEEFVKAGRIARFSERKIAMGILTTELRKTARELGGPQNAFSIALAEWNEREPSEIGRGVGEACFTYLCPAIDIALDNETRTRTCNDLVLVGFALAAYYAENSDYPESLDILIPNYLSEMPVDRFNDQPLHYVREESGYLLYSVGVNEIDEFGQTAKSQPAGDDIILKIGRQK